MYNVMHTVYMHVHVHVQCHVTRVVFPVYSYTVQCIQLSFFSRFVISNKFFIL